MDINAIEASGITIAIIASLFLVMCMLRAFIRRASRSVRTIGTSDPSKIIQAYKKAKGSIGRAWDWTLWLVLFTWIMCIIWSITFYLYIKTPIILAWGVAGSLSIIMFLRALTFMALNDFKYYESVASSKKWIENHNANVEQSRKRIAELKARMDSNDPKERIDINQY